MLLKYRCFQKSLQIFAFTCQRIRLCSTYYFYFYFLPIFWTNVEGFSHVCSVCCQLNMGIPDWVYTFVHSEYYYVQHALRSISSYVQSLPQFWSTMKKMVFLKISFLLFFIFFILFLNFSLVHYKLFFILFSFFFSFIFIFDFIFIFHFIFTFLAFFIFLLILILFSFA